MADAATALEPIKHVESSISTNLKIVFGYKGKLDELSKSALNDFRADILRLAGTQLANTTPANVDSFCSSWVQVQERFNNRRTALTTFKTQLSNTISYFKKEHSDELRAELQQLINKCDEELRQRNQVDENIIGQRQILQGWIEELETYDTEKAADTDGEKVGRSRVRKKTARKS
ncbi:MAG TPA: hypothetical protein VJM50_23525 [Pyrinomonadaceae bacterium]|nr:hypothetical protein [Pyrinomonadaceae bacterium]